MNNQDLRTCAKEHGVFLWQIADALGVSEPTLTRRFRKELDSVERERILRAIERIAEENAESEVDDNV